MHGTNVKIISRIFVSPSYKAPVIFVGFQRQLGRVDNFSKNPLSRLSGTSARGDLVDPCGQADRRRNEVHEDMKNLRSASRNCFAKLPNNWKVEQISNDVTCHNILEYLRSCISFTTATHKLSDRFVFATRT